MTRFVATICIAFLIPGGAAFSQPANRAPEFEVASLKLVIAGPAKPGAFTPHGGPGTDDPTRFTYAYANLATLIMRAYDARIDQIVGPDWMKDFVDPHTLYALTAVVPPDTSKAQFQLMLQNLLTRRFHLALHREAKEFAGYELVVAEGGQKLKEYVPGQDSPSADSARKNGFPPLGATMVTSLSSRIGEWGTIHQGFRMTMTEFAEALGSAINETNGLEAGAAMPRVADKTGLSGTWEFTLSFSGKIVMAGMPPSPGASDPGGAPSLFNALERQLGLKLVKTKNVPVDILIVDHADKVPTEN